MNPEDKADLERKVELANMGRQVLNNGAFKAAIATRKAQILDVFCRTTADQGAIRDEAWRMMQNMTALEQSLEQSLATGKMAANSLKLLDDKPD